MQGTAQATGPNPSLLRVTEARHSKSQQAPQKGTAPMQHFGPLPCGARKSMVVWAIPKSHVFDAQQFWVVGFDGISPNHWDHRLSVARSVPSGAKAPPDHQTRPWAAAYFGCHLTGERRIAHPPATVESG